jgi:hypothetical protein
MNERIKQLAEQAGYSWHNQFSGPILSPNAIEKFAELIVKECCLQVADVRIENDFEPVGDAVLVQALTGIKKHFGVQE